jgi:hypothetical protein
VLSPGRRWIEEDAGQTSRRAGSLGPLLLGLYIQLKYVQCSMFFFHEVLFNES